MKVLYILILFLTVAISAVSQSNDTITTKSGLRYFIKKQGSGPVTKRAWVIVIHYTMSLEDGPKVDSSRGKSEPFGFTLGSQEVIKGVNEAVSLMRVGDRAVFIIPYSMAYGKKGYGPIPPKATILYDIEVLDMVRNSLTDELQDALFEKPVTAESKPRVDKMLTVLSQLKEAEFKDYFVSEESLEHMGQGLKSHPEAAVEIFKLRVSLYPQSSAGYTSLGEVHYQLGENDKAIANFERALELNPSNAVANAMLKRLKNK